MSDAKPSDPGFFEKHKAPVDLFRIWGGALGVLLALLTLGAPYLPNTPNGIILAAPVILIGYAGYQMSRLIRGDVSWVKTWVGYTWSIGGLVFSVVMFAALGISLVAMQVSHLSEVQSHLVEMHIRAKNDARTDTTLALPINQYKTAMVVSLIGVLVSVVAALIWWRVLAAAIWQRDIQIYSHQLQLEKLDPTTPRF